MMAIDSAPPRDLSPLAPELASCLATIDANRAALGDHYPDDTTRDGHYPWRPATGSRPKGGNGGWTTGFWPGLLWLAWELTGDEGYRVDGERHVRSFARRIDDGVELDTHDLGFLYTLSCVAPWRLTGDDLGRRTALRAADLLAARLMEPAGIIQAWGDLDDPARRGQAIIDSLMNMPLLYWAAAVGGRPRLAVAAYRHTVQLRDHILRPDDTTYHTFFWSPRTGEAIRGATAQGYADDSCWARGQAWGIYGFALAYAHSGDPSMISVARRCADYFLDHLPEDGVPFWDLAFGTGSDQPRDSSAGAIAACGLDELARFVPDTDADRYRAGADRLLGALTTHAVPAHPGPGRPLLLHAVYDKPSGVGIDEGCLWGDYFYLEALLRRTSPGWVSPWEAGADLGRRPSA